MALIFQNFLLPHGHQKVLVRESKPTDREMGMGRINENLQLLQDRQRPDRKFVVNRKDEAATAVLGTAVIPEE